MENIEVKELTAEDVKTVEIVAASMNQIIRKYNALLANTVELKDFKQFQAEIILASREVASTLDKGGEEMGKLKKAFDGLMDVIKIQGDSITTLKTAFDPKMQRKTFRESVEEQLTKGVFNDFYERKTSTGVMRIETKDIAFTGTYGSGAAAQAVMPFQIPQMPPMENFDVRLLLPTGTIESSKLDFPQERAASLTDATASKAENAAADESTFGFTMTSVTAVRIPAFVEISRTALKNTAWLSNYISNRLMAFFVKELNRESIAGTGAGTDLNGLYNQANTFLAGAGSFAGSVANANFMDVLNMAAGEMEELYDLSPTDALLNPVNARILSSAKNTIADFINPATFLTSNNQGYTSIFGMRPDKTKNITIDKYLLANINPAYMQLLFNGPVEIFATDSHASNFINDLITLKIEAMVMLPVYNANALMKGTLSTDLKAITIL
jgi:hypothetical protein